MSRCNRSRWTGFRRARFRWHGDRTLAAVTGLAARLSALIVLFIVLFVLMRSWPALAQVGVLRFVTDGGWYPQAAAQAGQFNLLPMILASLLSAAGALVLAGPLGLLVAVFLSDYAPRNAVTPLRAGVELMAGVPSVVYGLWGLVTLVPLIAAWQPPGASLLTGILVLTLMLLPTMALAAHAALMAVPDEYRLAAAGLGFGRAGALWTVVIPAARSGLWGALILSLARASGETMAVLMVTGNVARVPDSLFAPVRTLTANIALELAYATEVHRSALFVSGLVLAGVVAVLVLVAERAAGAPRRG